MQQIAEFPPGAVIFHQGESGDVAYLIESGQVSVTRLDSALGKERELAVLGAGSILGEMALLDPAPRMASAHAVGRVSCAVFDAAIFRAQMQKLTPLGLSLLRALIRTQRHHAHGADVRDGVDQHFDLPKLRIEGAGRFAFDTEQVIYRPGDAAKGLFVILDGAVELRQFDGRGWTHYRTLTHDEVFGEQEVVHNRPRRHEARAVQLSNCIFIPATQFNEILASSPKFIAGLIKIYAANG
ncbi:MAG: cyclic nucleotide-binding domain-containing protein [Candidatus Symbiobacter sp.]|nr:cyclic nucleotide-binding domain-containing protein [Candidatus Symbiobacter sp.]